MNRAFVPACLVFLGHAAFLDAEVPAKYRPTIAKGLDWLAKQQHKDGHWGDKGDPAIAFTALAGMTFLQEGSTDHSGKYKKNIRTAIDWLLSKCNTKDKLRLGLIGDPDSADGMRYMFGHGLSLSLLSQACGEVTDMKLRGRIQEVVQRGVHFSSVAQATNGGWFYTSRMEGGDSSEGVATVFQLFGLREAKNAGFVVPKPTLQKSLDCLKDATGANGGIHYSLNRKGGERPVITAGALDFLGNDRKNPLFSTWLQYCHKNIPLEPSFQRNGEFVHFFYARVLWRLGEDGYAKLFPKSNAEERPTWSRYRTVMFDYLQKIQHEDGSWKLGGWSPNPICAAALFLSILQLDNQPLPLTPR